MYFLLRINDLYLYTTTLKIWQGYVVKSVVPSTKIIIGCVHIIDNVLDPPLPSIVDEWNSRIIVAIQTATFEML